MKAALVQAGLAKPWLRHYDAHVPPHLEYPEVPLPLLIKESAQKYPERVALVFFGRRIKYRELWEKVETFAASLRALGVEEGTRVALLLPNCPQFLIAYYAVLRLGAVVVPVNPLSAERELLYIFRDAGVKLLVSLDLFAPRVAAVRARLREEDPRLLSHVVYTSLKDFLPFPLNFLFPLQQKVPKEAKEAAKEGLSFLTLLQGKALEPEFRARVDVRRDLAALLYTAGTTGAPKGVMLSPYALVVNALHCKVWGNLNAEDKGLGVLPIFHGFGMSTTNALLLAGAAVVLLPRFEAGEVLRVIAKEKPTIFASVPTMIVALANHPDLKKYNLSSLRACFVGASSLPPELKKQFEELTGASLMEGYGLTEAVTAKCANPLKGVNKTGSIGIPFPDTVMCIVDAETGEKVLPPGEIGEIILQSPDLMLGYYGQPEATAQALRGGWLYTGDLGYMDEDGYFYIVDRKKDLIITGGFNVYPREVEDVLYAHPAVKEACVVGVPDAYRGEAVKAFVVLRAGKTVTEEELKAYCRQQLTPYKVPREIEFRESLPKSAIGKVLRKELKKEAEAKIRGG